MNAKKLIQDIRRGGKKKDQAITTIYRECLEKFRSKLQTFVKKFPESDLEDLYHDAIIKFVPAAEAKDIKDICSYIHTIGMNILNKKAGKGKKWRNIELKTDLIANYVPPENFDETLDIRLLEEEEEETIKELEKLVGKKCLKLIAGKSDYSMEKMAELLDYNNAKTAKNMKYKCIKKAQKKIKEHPDLERRLKFILGR